MTCMTYDSKKKITFEPTHENKSMKGETPLKFIGKQHTQAVCKKISVFLIQLFVSFYVIQREFIFACSCHTSQFKYYGYFLIFFSHFNPFNIPVLYIINNLVIQYQISPSYIFSYYQSMSTLATLATSSSGKIRNKAGLGEPSFYIPLPDNTKIYHYFTSDTAEDLIVDSHRK